MSSIETPNQESPEAPLPQPSPPARPGLQKQIRTFPVTFTLIGITLVFYLGQIISAQLFGADLVLYFGAKYNPGIIAGQWWRFITPVFIHGGLLHFGVNMYSLYVIGPAVERFFTSKRFLLVYLLSGIGGVVLSFAMSDSLSVGASGAIFGLVGALGGFFYTHRKILNVANQLRHLIAVTLLNLTLGLTPGIDNWGHIGGLITGALLSWWLGPRLVVHKELNLIRIEDQRPFSRILPRAAAAILVLFVSIILLVYNT